MRVQGSVAGIFRRVGVLVLLSLVLVSPVSAASDWERKDSSTSCDEIGWNVRASEFEDVDDELVQKHAACVNGVAYIAICGTTSGTMYFEPQDDENWIVCYIVAYNMTSSEKSVSMFDFSLVTDSGRKFSTDFSAMLSFDSADMFPSETLREGQGVEGMIGFAIPKSSKMPLTLEIDQLLNFSFTRSEVGVIVIPKLFRFGS